MSAYHVSDPGPEHVSILQELLDRKLYTVAKVIRPPFTAQDIVDNSLPAQWPFEDNDDVAPGCTLAGILYHRGTIAAYIRDSVPLKDWDSDILLSYFASNVNRERNFDVYHGQTRIRLFRFINYVHSGQQSALKRTYILACLEAKGSRLASRPRKTYFRELFIKVLQHHKTWAAFPSIGGQRVRNLTPKMKQQTHFHAQMWNQKGAKHAKLEQIMLYIELCGHGLVFDDSVSKFVGVQEDLPGKRQQQNPPKKRVRHRYAKPESAKKNEAPQPAQPSTPSIARLNQLPPMRSINLDVSKFAQPYGDNFVFKGLVAEFPGWDPEGVVDVVLDDEVQYDKMQVVEAGVDEMEVDGEEDEDIAGLPMDFSRLTIVELMRGLEDDVEMGDA